MARHVVVLLLLAAVGVVFAQGPENLAEEAEVLPERRLYRQMPTRCGHVTTYSSLQPRFLGGISLRGGTIYTFGTHPRSVEVVFQQSSRATDLAALVDRISERDSDASQLEQGYTGQASESHVSDAAERSNYHAFATILQTHPLLLNVVEMGRMLELQSQLMSGQAMMPSEEMSAEWNTEAEVAVRREPDIEDVDGPDRPVDVAAEWIRSPVETMVSQASMGVNKFLDSASIFSVAIVGSMLGAAIALFIRLLVVCFSAVWECCPEEEESMIVILTNPSEDEKETPLLLQKNVETMMNDEDESGVLKPSSEYKPPVAPAP